MTREQAQIELVENTRLEAEAWKAVLDGINQRDQQLLELQRQINGIRLASEENLKRLSDIWFPLHHRQRILLTVLE